MEDKKLGMTIPIARRRSLSVEDNKTPKQKFTLMISGDLKSKVDKYKRVYFRTFNALVEKLLIEWLEAVEEEEDGNGTKEDLH